MVSAEASCDLCLKEAIKSTERARIYSSTWTAVLLASSCRRLFTGVKLVAVS